MIAIRGGHLDRHRDKQFCIELESAAELKQYAGVAPVIEQSGQKKWTHWRYSRPTFLRQSFLLSNGPVNRFALRSGPRLTIRSKRLTTPHAS